MSSEQKPQEAPPATLESIIASWNGCAPFLDGLAHKMDIGIDASGDLRDARNCIGALLRDCQQIQAVSQKNAQRPPEEQAVLEEAEKELRKRAEAAGVKLKSVPKLGPPPEDQEAAEKVPEPEKADESATGS
ncbi:MAG: hypothetical protein BMS9Abin32_157 [Gammaproteobacteria bacterium]|nr:MAG: hypothetical protein BMS9Abin32_157 [Gammaproteobacteria bacterium]